MGSNSMYKFKFGCNMRQSQLACEKNNNNKKKTYPHMNDGEVAHHQKNLGSDACVSSWSVGSSLRW